MPAPDITLLVRAADFAARRHRRQRRMGSKAPYVNHPLSVARRLVEIGGVDDAITLAAAILHDTVEDTDATHEQLAAEFGDDVAAVVAECSDDLELSKDERKRRQIRDAAGLSMRARLVKLADKLDNLSDLAQQAPSHWNRQRVRGYFVWSHAVVAGLRGANAALEAALDRLFAQHVPSDPQARQDELEAYLAVMAEAGDR